MIKTIPLELDGFYYNIIQMTGKQAWTLKLTLLNAIPELILDLKKLNDRDLTDENATMAVVLEIMASAFRHVKASLIMPLVEELLTTIKYIDPQSNKAIIEANGFDPKRHSLGSLVHIDVFVGKDAVHLPLILYHILKANYSDFFIQLKQRLGSSLGQNMMGLMSKTQA